MELRPADLLKEWKAGRFRPVYYFFGEEPSGKGDALAELVSLFKPDAFNHAEFSGDMEPQAGAVVSECLTIPVFADKRLVVVRTAKLMAQARSVLAEYLKAPSQTTTLVLFSDDKKPDGKDVLARAVGDVGATCVFGPLGDDEARRLLREAARQAGKELTEEAADALVSEAGTQWAVLRQELEKTLLYCAQDKKVDLAAVAACLGYQKAADPFALTRLIQARDMKACLSHLRRMLKDGKPEDQAFRALNQVSASVLKQLRAKRLQRAGAPQEQIYRSLRLHPYWDKDYLASLTKFPEGRLKKDLRRCIETETSLKSKAWLDARVELEMLIVDLCARNAAKPGF
jgi:DNA polymerase-3 subunit delta